METFLGSKEINPAIIRKMMGLHSSELYGPPDHPDTSSKPSCATHLLCDFGKVYLTLGAFVYSSLGKWTWWDLSIRHSYVYFPDE